MEFSGLSERFQQALNEWYFKSCTEGQMQSDEPGIKTIEDASNNKDVFAFLAVHIMLFVEEAGTEDDVLQLLRDHGQSLVDLSDQHRAMDVDSLLWSWAKHGDGMESFVAVRLLEGRRQVMAQGWLSTATIGCEWQATFYPPNRASVQTSGDEDSRDDAAAIIGMLNSRYW